MRTWCRLGRKPLGYAQIECVFWQQHREVPKVAQALHERVDTVSPVIERAESTELFRRWQVDGDQRPASSSSSASCRLRASWRAGTAVPTSRSTIFYKWRAL